MFLSPEKAPALQARAWGRCGCWRTDTKSLVPSGPTSLDRIQKVREAAIFLTCHTPRLQKSEELVTTQAVPAPMFLVCGSTGLLHFPLLTQHHRGSPPPAQEQSIKLGHHARGTTGSNLVLSLLPAGTMVGSRSGEITQLSSCLGGRTKYLSTYPTAMSPEPLLPPAL